MPETQNETQESYHLTGSVMLLSLVSAILGAAILTYFLYAEHIAAQTFVVLAATWWAFQLFVTLRRLGKVISIVNHMIDIYNKKVLSEAALKSRRY